MKRSWTVTLEEDDQGKLVIPFTPEVLAELGWTEGDVLRWHDNQDGTWSITKKADRD